ncbi:MAG TPA: nucleotidyltransferase domain-containing protein [Peptococcaceae bacterium]|jgi:predicted nucleotidyltransferase|nr:nucleotidyltransferase domain-containing protein [Clostridia bacterium]HPZ71505.1 nucleotidyltransferase domain-containing protein [Peptococcaceae bacterium]HQD54451.1 nucleotidyltransferase domain-containing protein [Peptococcaceae bacterium]
MDKVIEQIKHMAQQYKIKKIVLFGSRARGDYGIASDYDLAVFADGLSPGSFCIKAYF